MSDGKRTMLHILLAVMPFLLAMAIGFLLSLLNISKTGQEAMGIMILFLLIIAPFFIMICGGIFSLIVAKRADAERLSTLGYAIPAIILCFMVITSYYSYLSQ